MPSGRSFFASQSIMLKKIENNVGDQDIPLLDAIRDGEAA